MRLSRMLLISAFMLLGMLTAAHAQRPPPLDPWEFLGEQSVGFKVDTDSIVINQNEEWYRTRAYRRLRFVAERNDVHLISIRVVYLNGHTEDLNVNQLIRRNGQIIVDLRGERSYLRQIDMRYRSNLGIRIGPGGIDLQQAVVKVYGERAPRRPEPPVAVAAPALPGGWSEIDTSRFNRQAGRTVLTASRSDGRFGQIAVRSLGEPIEIQSLVIRFRNGQTQTTQLNRSFEPGELSPPIDLAGDQRFIDNVTVILQPRRRPGPAELQLLGTRRPGHEGGPAGDRYSGRGWVPLGEQTVGFTVDRDVINIGQSEEWFRNRGFRTLHFVAERSEVHMMSIRITYLNGYQEEIRVDRLIPVGGDHPVDLRGERSYLRSIEMVYRSRPSFRGQAVIKVYGEPVRR